MNTDGLVWFAGYILVFFTTLVGVICWDRRRRRTRNPLPEDLRLLRMPGEYLLRRVMEHDENDAQSLVVAMFIPVLAGAGVLYFVARYLQSWLVLGLVATVVVLVFSLLACIRCYLARVQRRANDYLGFFGERYVAECLEPLKADGWFFFHDVPCAGATGKFNIDHVAVGPGGIWLVETKTRRKGRARQGFKDHEVASDGTKIIWPWGEDKDALRQASDNARWLREWIEKMTGKALDVAAVLTFPGYYVIERKLGAVRVVNPKLLPQVLTSRGRNLLTREQIDLVRRQLEERCRDVEY